MSQLNTNSVRPAIPAELKRRVLVEAGHRCAIPTCRYIQVEIHHIIPWEKSKKHDYANLIALCANCHNRADNGEIDRKSLRMYKANLRFAVEKYSQFEIDVLFELFNSKVPHVQFPKYLYLLITRLLDAGFVEFRESGGCIWWGDVKVNPDYLIITELGRGFVKSLDLAEIGY